MTIKGDQAMLLWYIESRDHHTSFMFWISLSLDCVATVAVVNTKLEYGRSAL